MDCCNYGEYRAAYGGMGAGAGWDGYAPYAPLQYTPYAPPYYTPHAHEPYARYAAAAATYRYDYPAVPQHVPHSDHASSMDYGPYAAKEVRARRAMARRDARSRTPVQQFPLPPTPPLECGMNGRGPAYCEPQMWHHYQMGMMNGGGWGGASASPGAWSARGFPCSREQMSRYPTDYRPMKGIYLQTSSQIYPPDGRSTPYSMYEGSPYSSDSRSRHGGSAEPAPVCDSPAGTGRAGRERRVAEANRSPPVEKRPALVPLPAFQQAFGSTEIGKFSEAFSRTEVVQEDVSSDTFNFESFTDWDGPSEPQWSSREIKLEDSL